MSVSPGHIVFDMSDYEETPGTFLSGFKAFTTLVSITNTLDTSLPPMGT